MIDLTNPKISYIVISSEKIDDIMSILYAKNYQIIPIKGINITKNIHPLFPTSCSRRTATAVAGKNTANTYIIYIRPKPKPSIAIPNRISKTLATTPKIELNRKKNQYSLRLDLPLKIAYLSKTVK